MNQSLYNSIRLCEVILCEVISTFFVIWTMIIIGYAAFWTGYENICGKNTGKKHMILLMTGVMLTGVAFTLCSLNFLDFTIEEIICFISAFYGYSILTTCLLMGTVVMAVKKRCKDLIWSRVCPLAASVIIFFSFATYLLRLVMESFA